MRDVHCAIDTTMRLLFAAALSLFCLQPSHASLQCYSGWQNWEEGINNVSKIYCGPQHRCCYMIASAFTGTNYGCYDDCPSDRIQRCGPDPKLGIQDIHYCYCKDAGDKNCRPENSHK